MFRSRIPTFRLLVMVGLILLLCTVAYGFAAANTVPTSGAGDGSNTISGYTITNVAYTLNTTNPANIDKVTFTVTPGAGAAAPSTVKAKLVSSSSTWSSCTNTSGTTWDCTVSGVTATAAD